jgi:hypothetical protein
LRSESLFNPHPSSLHFPLIDHPHSIQGHLRTINAVPFHTLNIKVPAQMESKFAKIVQQMTVRGEVVSWASGASSVRNTFWMLKSSHGTAVSNAISYFVILIVL